MGWLASVGQNSSYRGYIFYQAGTEISSSQHVIRVKLTEVGSKSGIKYDLDQSNHHKIVFLRKPRRVFRLPTSDFRNDHNSTYPIGKKFETEVRCRSPSRSNISVRFGPVKNCVSKASRGRKEEVLGKGLAPSRGRVTARQEPGTDHRCVQLNTKICSVHVRKKRHDNYND